MGKSVSRNSAFSMINKGLSVVFPLVTVSYISRVLGAAGIGEVSSAQNLATYFSMAAALGIPSYGVRAIAQSKRDENSCNKTFSELFTINFISSIIATVVYLITAFCFKINNSNTALALIFSSIIVFNVINIEWVYQGYEEYEYIMIRSFVIKIVSLLLLFIFVRKKSDLVAYAFIICFGSIGNYVLNFINLKRYVKLSFCNISLKKHIRPIMTFFVSVIAIEIYSLLDVSMLTVMSNATSVGYYSNSTKIVKAVANTLTGISAVLMPRFSYLFSEDNKSEIKKLSRQFLNVTFLISVPCCCGIILVADQIVEVLFGVEFLPAISTIRILSILIVLMPLSGGVFCQLLLTAGKEKSYLACVLIGTVVNVVLNYLLIPTLTQNGAAIASVVAEFTVSISMIVATRRTIKVNMCCRDVFSILTSAFVMSLTLVLCHKLFFGQAVWMRLLVEIVIAVLVYFLCVFMLKNSASSKIIRMIKK